MVKKRKNNSLLAGLGKKSPLFFLKIAVVISAAMFAAYQSATHAVANIAWQQNPELALRFDPDHSFALSGLADVIFEKSQDPASLKRVERLAKRALTAQPLDPVAIRLLGYVADARGDKVKARRLVKLAHKISRRDLSTQLWLIEDAVAQNNKKLALFHYDIAMRATPKSHQLLFSTLGSALADEEVRSGLLPYFRQRPAWLPAFLAATIETDENNLDLANLLLQSDPLPTTAEYRNISNALLSKLVAKSEFGAFQQYYKSLSGTTAETLASVALDTTNVDLRYIPAGWQAAESGAIAAIFSSPNAKGRYSMSVVAGSGERGAAMQKILFLKPGSYRFSATYMSDMSASDAEIRWDVNCLSKSGPKGIWSAITGLSKGKSSTSGDFKIGPECPNQHIIMQVAAGSSQQGIEFIVDSINLASS